MVEYSMELRMKINKNKIFILFFLFLSLLYLDGEEISEEVEKVNEKHREEKYELKHVDVKEFLRLIERSLKENNPIILYGDNSFLLMATDSVHRKVKEYIAKIDTAQNSYAVTLRYIKSEDLLRYLPPSVNREEIVISSDPNIIFCKGNEYKYKKFLKELDIIDKPESQIRYQLLVVQYERSESLNWAKSLSLNKREEAGKSNRSCMYEFSGVMSNIFNISFDLVSKFGYQFIAKLNFELSENKARVLADTTLNGLTGEEVSFRNTNTFRFVDRTIDSSGKPLYGAVREVTSGLLVNIKGSVSGAGMVTMEVNAQVSKQGSGSVSSGVLPPTSEKIVKTKVRSESGTPIIIGGLLQVENNADEKKIPGLGDIPILGYAFKDKHSSDTVSEMVIYIVPYIHREGKRETTVTEDLKRLYEKYGKRLKI